MKKTLRNLLAGAAVLFSAGLAQQAQASHFQGGDMTYVCVAPNMYSVNLKLYRDCTGASAPASATLNIKSPGCNSGRNITMTKVGANRIGSPYCAQIPVTCTATGRTNFEEVTFTSTVAFTAAEQTCNNWVLSWSECCRPSSANLVGQDSPWQEAMINLAAGINNNSPQFSPLNIPIPFVNYNKPIQISLNAMESDGDSLVYSLSDPWNASGTEVPKKSYTANMIYNSDSTKYALAPGGNYSKTYPIFSYYADWTQPMPITPVKKFMFDTKTGSMGFIPNLYHPGSLSSTGVDKYVLVVQIDEWRKINGVPTKIGYIRRDMMINVIDCGPNQNPNISAPVVNGQQISETDVINLRPGSPMNMQLATLDADTFNILSVESDVAQVLPGATFVQSSGNQPTVSVYWTPSASHVSNRIYYFHVTVKDDACPVKGYQTYTFGVRVSATGGVTGVKDQVNKPAFVAYPNPFTETVSFKLNIAKGAEQQLVIYNALGQQVDKIALNGLGAGEQTIVWKNASKMANGQYVAKLLSNKTEIQTIKFSKLQ